MFGRRAAVDGLNRERAGSYAGIDQLDAISDDGQPCRHAGRPCIWIGVDSIDNVLDRGCSCQIDPQLRAVACRNQQIVPEYVPARNHMVAE